MNKKSALITGVTGQDGSYMAELLLSKGYEVHGTVRRSTGTLPSSVSEHPDFYCYHMDLLDVESIYSVVGHVKPDEVYNFAAQSHVGDSFQIPNHTYQVTGVGACTLMDTVFGMNPKAKFYQASTSEMIGNRTSRLENFHPDSPYAVAKLMAHMDAVRHNNAGKFAVSAVLFNHESERRPDNFVTQKICKFAVATLKWEMEHKEYSKPQLHLGNLESVRDWGYAPEYVEIIWKLMQEKTPRVGVEIGTGVAISVRSFLNIAFNLVGLDWKSYTYFDQSCVRPVDVNYLKADPEEANKLLGRPMTDVFGLIPLMLKNQCLIQGVNPSIIDENARKVQENDEK